LFSFVCVCGAEWFFFFFFFPFFQIYLNFFHVLSKKRESNLQDFFFPQKFLNFLVKKFTKNC
jgi:hypothetical protein